jgi:hypothetical protein
MKNETAVAILTMLGADQTVEPDHREAIKASIAAPVKKAAPRDLIDPTEVARILGCCTRTVSRRAKKDYFKPIKQSDRRVLYDRDEIIKYYNYGISAE